MFYITAASTISHQPTFRNPGFSNGIGELGNDWTMVNPDFKEYIEPALLRRMSKILRMSVTCAKDCLRQAGIQQPDSIVVGTGLGCLSDTEKFLNNFLTIEGLLPPTAFIQSTHNTIAGQISLSLGNHGYNMTHTQNTLSFEHAMLDGMLLLGENDENVLVGAADEYIGILDDIGAALKMAPVFLTSGASFFVISNRPENALVSIVDVETVRAVSDLAEIVNTFLCRNGLDEAAIDQVLFSDESVFGVPGHLSSCFPDTVAFVNYPLFSGFYATNSAFALHLAIDKMQSEPGIRHILILNHLLGSNLGLTLLQSLEA